MADKSYYEAHREERKEYQRRYYQENRVRINEKQKQRRARQRAAIQGNMESQTWEPLRKLMLEKERQRVRQKKEYQKAYYQKNKDRIRQQREEKKQKISGGNKK